MTAALGKPPPDCLFHAEFSFTNSALVKKGETNPRRPSRQKSSDGNGDEKASVRWRRSTCLKEKAGSHGEHQALAKHGAHWQRHACVTQRFAPKARQGGLDAMKIVFKIPSAHGL